MIQNAFIVGWIPGDGNSGTEVAVVCIEKRIATGVFDRTNTNSGVEHLALLGRLPFGLKIAVSRKDFTGIQVSHQGYAVKLLGWRRRPTVVQPIIHGERWTHAPGVLKVKLEVVHV